MFPICERCGCETLTPDCGAWTPEFRHDCLKSLEAERNLAIRKAAEIMDKITKLRSNHG